MLGPGRDDPDVIGMGPDRPRRSWVTIGRRTRRLLAVAGVGAVLAAGAAVAAVRLTAPSPSQRALARLVSEVTTVPVGPAAPAAAAVSDGGYYFASSTSSPASVYSTALSFDAASVNPVSGPRLSADGRPEVLYITNGYCPYCVAENWALIVALSRFGQFSGLGTSRSPQLADIAPVDGWTFYGSSYSSPYLAFVPVELRSGVLVGPRADPGTGTSYRVLQPLTPGQRSVVGRLDGSGQTPFLDFGGAAVMFGSNVSPPALAGLTWSQIAGDLRRQRTAAGTAVIAGAGVLTAELCQLTGDRPAAACPGSGGGSDIDFGADGADG